MSFTELQVEGPGGQVEKQVLSNYEKKTDVRYSTELQLLVRKSAFVIQLQGNYDKLTADRFRLGGSAEVTVPLQFIFGNDALQVSGSAAGYFGKAQPLGEEWRNPSLLRLSVSYLLRW